MKMFLKPSLTCCIFLLFITSIVFSQSARITTYSYAVVISNAAYTDAGWKSVADTLMTIHAKGSNRVKLLKWSTSVSGLKNDLIEFAPDYIGYIAKPAAECNSAFIREVKTLTCALDNDPFADAVWGVITGFVAADAMRAVTSSLRAKTRVSGDELASPWMPEHFMFKQNQPDVEVRFADGTSCTSKTLTGPDRVVPICTWLNSGIKIDVTGYPGINGTVDVLITGGHGNINTWQAHYPDAGTEGFLMSNNGQLYGDPYSGNNINVNKTTPTVYYAINNCLIGNPDNINNMTYAWFHTGYAVNMFGYLESTSCSEVFYRGVLRFSKDLTPGEAHFLGFNNIIHDLQNKNYFLANESGLIFNRDESAVYGDPKADVYVVDDPLNDAKKEVKDTLRHIATPQAVPDTFEFVSTVTGSQFTAGEWYVRPLRPASFLPVKIDAATINIEKNEGHFYSIAEEFVIFDAWMPKDVVGTYVPQGKVKKLRWTAQTKPLITPIHSNLHEYQKAKQCVLSAQCRQGKIVVKITGLVQPNTLMCLYNTAGRELARHSVLGADENTTIDMTNGISICLGSGIYYVVMKSGRSMLKTPVTYLPR